METVKVSSKYQIVIPKEIREAMGIRPGQRLRVFAVGDLLQYAKERPMQELRGMFPGMDTTIERDEEDRV
ncbi:MAG: AbrB/MazE/SpoVT family DNA-binding domain-containing protein [Desulfovibrionaceae bacterium]